MRAKLGIDAGQHGCPSWAPASARIPDQGLRWSRRPSCALKHRLSIC